jgi:hypothetical protein
VNIEKRELKQSSWSIVIEEMVGGQHRVDEREWAGQVRVTQMKEATETTRLVCRRRSLREFSDMQNKELLQ